MSNMLARYEISCSQCGVLDFQARKSDAWTAAMDCLDRHTDWPAERIFIYDRMAHVGKVELWVVDKEGMHAARVRR
jgi:hypothetical protein